MKIPDKEIIEKFERANQISIEILKNFQAEELDPSVALTALARSLGALIASSTRKEEGRLKCLELLTETIKKVLGEYGERFPDE